MLGACPLSRFTVLSVIGVILDIWNSTDVFANRWLMPAFATSRLFMKDCS